MLSQISKIPAKNRNVRREFTKQLNFRWVKLWNVTKTLSYN